MLWKFDVLMYSILNLSKIKGGIMKDFLSCCLGLAIVSGATYGWIELMLHLKQDEKWSVADITLLSLLGPGEAAVGLAILLSLYRNRVTIDMESFNLLKW